MVKLRTILLGLGLGAAAMLPARGEDVVITQFKVAPAGAPFGIAIDKGFFKKHGVDITEVISGEGGGTSVRNIIASDLGYGESTVASAVAAMREGQDVKIVDIGARSLADSYIVTMPASTLKSLSAADLKGRKWGISNPKSLGEMIAVMSMEKVGLKNEEMQRLAFGSLGGAMTALEKGVVDVMDMNGTTFKVRGGESKYRVLGRADIDIPQMPQAVGIASGKLMRENPDKLRRILAARREAVQFMYANPAESAKLLVKVYEQGTPELIADLVERLTKANYWSEGQIEMEPIRNAVRGMRSVGLIDSDPDLEKMIDRSFLPSDLQK